MYKPCTRTLFKEADGDRMVLISLKDYAAERRVSYEAVRQQVKRYHAELEDHIIREGRQQFLDEAAVAFLDEKRQKNPVVIIQQDKDEQIETLNQQVTVLLAKTASQAEQIAELERWKADHALAIAKADQNLQLLAESREQLVQAQADNEANTKKSSNLNSVWRQPKPQKRLWRTIITCCSKGKPSEKTEPGGKNLRIFLSESDIANEKFD